MPFTPQQESWITLTFGATRKIQTVRRLFRKHFNLSPRYVPGYNSFKRDFERFNGAHSAAGSSKKRGRPTSRRKPLKKVKVFLKPCQDNKNRISTSEIAKALQLSKTTVWRILRKKLRWFPYEVSQRSPSFGRIQGGPDCIVPMAFATACSLRRISDMERRKMVSTSAESRQTE